MRKNTENIIYGKSLQDIRKRNNLTQEQVSQITGLETKYISQIECGMTKGTINTMLKFCDAYKVTPNDILCKFIKNSTTQKEIDKIEKNFMKLSQQDRKVVSTLINALLDREK